MKYIITFCLAMFLNFSFAQNIYKTAIGIKGGYPSYGSLNIKYRLNNLQSIEGSIGGSAIGVSSSGVILEGMYEINSPLKENGLEWYYGGGAIIGLIKEVDLNAQNGMSNGFLTGLKGIIGIEYTFEEFPLNLALDTGPVLLFSPLISFTWGGALAIRYSIFNK